MTTFTIQNISLGMVSIAGGRLLKPTESISNIESLTVAEYENLVATGLLKVTPNPVLDSVKMVYVPAENNGLGIYNRTVNSRRAIQRAVATVKADVARRNIALYGDSLMAGQGAGTGASGIDGSFAKSIATRLKDLLTLKGINARTNSFFASHSFPDAQIETADPRLLLQSPSWGQTAQEGPGGPILRNNTDNKAGRFTIADTVDTVDVYDRVSVGAKSMQISRGGALSSGVLNGTETNLTGGLLSQNAADAYRKTTLAIGVSGPVTLNFARATGSIAYMGGMDAYNSADPDLAIFNFGRAGAVAQTLVDLPATNVIVPLNQLTLFASSLVIYMLGVNEWNNARSIQNFVAYSEQFLKAAEAAGASILVVCPPPTNPTANGTTALQKKYEDAMALMASKNNWMFISLFETFVSYADSSTLYYDNNHLNAVGYALAAERLMEVFE